MGFLLMIIICYLIGSIPCGYLIGKRNNIDIRRYGSGNIGATNAFRVLGTQLGLLVLFCDAVKGFLSRGVLLEFPHQHLLQSINRLFRQQQPHTILCHELI